MNWIAFALVDLERVGVNLVFSIVCDEAREEANEPYFPAKEVVDCVVMEPPMPSTWDFGEGLDGSLDG